ncbi:DUF6470 family protein [Proteocatella sphenisci]|uniref:DUF6470 family protein n=1 Tax=Proteocatella sphenisci TaxID=181070 RepID=UPI00048B70B5|nr:DUF6470 family protein [Proteocatella sphenisci]
MGPLIKITRVPMAYELKINNARIERRSRKTDLNLTTDKGGLRIESNNIKVSIDTFEARNSVVPTARRSIEQAAEKGKSAAYEAAARYTNEGTILMDAKLDGNALNQIFKNRVQLPTGEFQLGFTPAAGAEISWSEPNVSIQYEMDKLNFEFKITNGDFEFIPGGIEMNITQYPDVIIEYIGKPIYVPASADPEHEGFSLQA